jgi:hypothetical protein
LPNRATVVSLPLPLPSHAQICVPTVGEDLKQGRRAITVS